MVVHALERHSGEALAIALIFAYQHLCIDGFPVLDADRSTLTTQNLLSFERNGFIRIPSLGVSVIQIFVRVFKDFRANHDKQTLYHSHKNLFMNAF